MTDLSNILQVAAAGLRAQSARMRVIAENLANADSTAKEPGQDPYRRRVPTFDSQLDRATGATLVHMDGVRPDMSDFGVRLEPGHPAADADGYVRTPNVNSLVELMDLREAQRGFEANLNVVEASRSMLMRTIDLLRK
jgi:flagellar basal-body rod protein FlgC